MTEARFSCHACLLAMAALGASACAPRPPPSGPPPEYERPDYPSWDAAPPVGRDPFEIDEAPVEEPRTFGHEGGDAGSVEAGTVDAADAAREDAGA